MLSICDIKLNIEMKGSATLARTSLTPFLISDFPTISLFHISYNAVEVATYTDPGLRNRNFLRTFFELFFLLIIILNFA